MIKDERYDFTFTRLLLEHYVETSSIVGASLQVTHQGETVLATQIGYADREKGHLMSADTIFRIFSMTKPVTAVLALILYERGLIHLQDPVSDYLPGFRNTQVYFEQTDGVLTTEPARSPLTLFHLLTMTSGIPYLTDDTPSSQEISLDMQKIALEAQALGRVPDLPAIANRIGAVPLAFHPGEHWLYGLSMDVIGAVIEVVTGKKLGLVMREEIFKPLGMSNTGFSIPPDQADHLAGLYLEAEGQLLPNAPSLISGDPTKPPFIEYGGAGLYSTRSDFTRFAKMLLGNGSLDGRRILSSKSVSLMRQNHLNAGQLSDFIQDYREGYGYGLGVRSLLNPGESGSLAGIGEFGWAGAAGTWFGVDPAEDLTIVYLVQRLPGARERFIPRLLATIYAAL